MIHILNRANSCSDILSIIIKICFAAPHGIQTHQDSYYHSPTSYLLIALYQILYYFKLFKFLVKSWGKIAQGVVELS
jgi:hypothetical protein